MIKQDIPSRLEAMTSILLEMRRSSITYKKMRRELMDFPRDELTPAQKQKMKTLIQRHNAMLAKVMPNLYKPDSGDNIPETNL